VYYSERGAQSPLFVRSAQRRHFKRLAAILGVSTGDEVRAKFAEKRESMPKADWNSPNAFDDLVNLSELDTIA
jgi:hypothetical protein